MTELIYALLLAFGIAVAWFLIDNATESLGAKSFWDSEDEYYDGPVTPLFQGLSQNVTSSATLTKVEAPAGLPEDSSECDYCGSWGPAPRNCPDCGAPVPKTKFQLAWENSPRYQIR